MNKFLINIFENIRKSAFLYLFLFFLIGCNQNKTFMPMANKKTFHYDVTFIDKEKKKEIFKQAYFFIGKKDNNFTYLRNDGKLITFTRDRNALFLSELNYTHASLVDLPSDKLFFEKENILLKFPTSKDESWTSQDQTTLIMKMGYDRIYKTLLPIQINNKIQEIDVSVKLGDKILKNCVLVVGEGDTSYNPGPPLTAINIKIKQKHWYSPKYGLVKVVREELSDSETMGNIFYEKKLNLD